MSPEHLIIAAGILSFIGLLALQSIATALRKYQRIRRMYLAELRSREQREHRGSPIVNSTMGSTATDHEAKTAELDLAQRVTLEGG